MIRYFIIALLVLHSFHTSAQKPLVDVFIPGTVLIQYKSGGSASGVIVGDNSYMYLVTARHCLFKENQRSLSLIDTAMYLIYYVDDPFGGKADTLLVNTTKALSERDLLYDPSNDIAILTIAKVTGNTISGNPIFQYTNSVMKLTQLAPGGVSTQLCLTFDKVGVGDDCTIIGYPASLKTDSDMDYDFQRPLLRKGAIAGKDNNRGTIIIDLPSYQGNSGGPVFSYSFYGDSKIGLIGVVSRSILHVEYLDSKYYKATVSMNLTNSGYTVVVPIEYALELMSNRRARR